MRAFTLVELLAVIGLMTLIIAGGIYTFGLAREGVLRQQTKTQLAKLATQIEANKVKTSSYPKDEDEFLDLCGGISGTTDPWGVMISYEIAQPNNGFILTSCGANPENRNDDIVYDSSKN
jgi:type II secretory pathway pseudopilin PulG